MQLSRTAYVILGMVRLGRRTGYEIKSLVDVSTRFFWAASYGQIYPELERLEEAGLLEGEDDPESGRRRRSHRLTEAGERALHDWLTSSEPLEHELRDEGVLKFFFADALEPDERAALLRRMREQYEGVRQRLLEIRPGAQAARDERGGEEFAYLTLEWGISHAEFMADWCARMELRVKEGD
jgi:PadR family transcriptional regulator, regulatory protein AphA